MKTLSMLLLLCASCTPGVPRANAELGPDPTQTDGDKYRVILENEQVRVLRYHDEPGAKTHPHQHPHPFVVYALAPFQRRLTLPGGKPSERTFKTGDVAFMPAQSHVGENIGSTPTESLLIELKKP